MKILMACAELAPLARTGGLAEAVAGLSAALARRGHEVRVLLPRYGDMSDLPPVVESTPHAPNGGRYLEVRQDDTDMRTYLLDAPALFGGRGIYTGDDRDAARFLALSEAAAAFGEALEWPMDVIHCHDWHAAAVPVLLRAGRRGAAPCSVLTLHNIGYQGTFPAAAIDGDAYPGILDFVQGAGGDPAALYVNLLRIGLQTADMLTTVSPTYAREIQDPAFSMGLDDLLRERSGDLVGILNGVDYSIWDPRVDPHIGVHYDAANPAPKQQVKTALCAELGLTCPAGSPLIGAVTRLVAQKGIDLLIEILPDLLSGTHAAFALLGSGDAQLEKSLTDLAALFPQRVAFTRGYDEVLSHRIFAGSDIVVMPSRYEPCGLAQMFALRYGSVPVVRATGGLADTIQDFDPDTGTGNGSRFEHADAAGLRWGIGQALSWYADAGAWHRLTQNAMAADFSWDRRIDDYVSVYERARRPRA